LTAGPAEPTCAFCDPQASPGVLTENEHIRLIPDLFPVAPGHVLLVSKEHLACYGAASPAVLGDLEQLAQTAAAFVRQEYRVEPVLWENGGAGQTVFHAHLHVMPVALDAIEEVIESEHMREVSGWDDVASLWQAHGAYHYLQFQEHRRLIEGNGAMNWEFRRRVAIAAGMRFEGGRLVRATTDDDVRAVSARWEQYRQHR